MPMRPDHELHWADGANADPLPPDEGQMDVGYEGGETPGPGVIDYLFLVIFQWLEQVDRVFRGARQVWTEHWRFAIANAADHLYDIAESGSPFVITVRDPDTTHAYRYLRLAGGNGAGSSSIEGPQFAHVTTLTEIAMSWPMDVDSFNDSTNYESRVGLRFTSNAAHMAVIFKDEDNDGCWGYRVTDASGTTSVITEVLAVAGQTYQMRIEYSGGSPNGTVRFYIDDVLVGTVNNANVAVNTNAMTHCANVETSGEDIGHLHVGPITVSVDRRAA